MGLVGEATIPLVLLVLGGTLAMLPTGGHRNVRLVAALVAAKLVIVPGLALLVIPLLGLSAQIAIVMMVAAMQPPALNLAVQAKEFAAPKAQELINEGLFFSYLASVITLTAFLSILKMIL